MTKKVFLTTLLFAFFTIVQAQDFNTTINNIADSISKKILLSERKKVAITDFINNNESITRLGTFLSEEISSELANKSDNQRNFKILERAKIDQIFQEQNLAKSVDATKKAKALGKLAIADILIFATITDFDGYYRVVIKLLDTKEGIALSSYKVNFVKTPSLENLNKETVFKNNSIQLDSQNDKEKKEIATECNTSVVIKNKSETKITLIIYDGPIGNGGMDYNNPGKTGQQIAKLTIAENKSKALKINKEATYYYSAYQETDGQPTIGGPPKSWSGIINSEECKTVYEDIE